MPSRAQVAGSWLLEAGVLTGVMLVPAAMYAFGRSPFGPPKLVTLMLATCLTCAGFLLDARARDEATRLLRTSRVAWAAGALLGVAALATVMAVDRQQAAMGGYPDYRGMLTIVACAVLGLGAGVIAQREDALLRFWRGVVVVSLGILGFGVLQRLGVVPAGPSGYFKAGMRISTTLGNSSNYGVFLVMLAPLLVQRAIAEKSRAWQWAAGVAAVLSVLGWLWALSRGAWLGGLAVLVVWPIMIGWAGRTRTLVVRIAAGLAIALVLAAVGAAITPEFTKRASELVDARSRTAAWRVSAWSSSVQMTLDRPFLGYGPNTYRLVYPAYQAPNQVSGGRGYRVIESAHNVFFDVSTSFGLAGLAAFLALLAMVVRASARELARTRSGLALGPTAAAALLGGLVAIQFHYITMDTGPMFAALVAFIASTEVLAEEGARAPAPAYVRPIAAVVLGVYSLALLAALGLAAADTAAARGAAAAKAGAPWPIAHEEFAAARRLAPWEPQIRRAEGTAATATILKRYDPVALADGVAALDAVEEATPLDTGIVVERANLLLAAGVASRDPALLGRAVKAFEPAMKRDPNTGIPRAGRAAALLALGRTEEAIEEFEAALALSPLDRTAWRNLAAAYEQVGRVDEAKKARERAKK